VTLGEALRRAASESPGAEAYVYGGRRLTYRDWNVQSDHAAANLLARGAVKGERVALVLPPRPEYGVAYLAAAKAGLVTVGVNPRLADPEVEHVLADSDARFIVAIDRFGGREYARTIESLRNRLPGLDAVWVVASEAASPPSFDSFDRLLDPPTGAARERLEAVERSIGCDDPVAIVYTSGTTGKPKGALFALRSLEAVARTRGDMGMEPGERVLAGGTPFAHIGYMTKILGHIEDRQTTVILDSFKARAVLKSVERERITHLGGVPTQWALLLLDPEFDRFDLSSLRGGAIGGAPFSPELVREIRRRFAIDLVTRYSATEIALGTGSRPGDSEELLAETVGKAASEVEVAIVDEERKPLPLGAVGEVAVRSPAVMAGYWRRAEETAAVLDRDGWFYTGDLGALDEQGYLRLRGRKKEMYIRGGYNVYPVEVESLLARHPAIAQAAVVGVADPVLGEKGLAVIVPREGSAPPTAEEIREFCRSALADYKAPDYVEIRSELPVNAMYKIDKQRLSQEWTRRSVGRKPFAD
jgi:acyl-CoA synthetase (AMP-forming)/AMP-acid ligase II